MAHESKITLLPVMLFWVKLRWKENTWCSELLGFLGLIARRISRNH